LTHDYISKRIVAPTFMSFNIIAHHFFGKKIPWRHLYLCPFSKLSINLLLTFLAIKNPIPFQKMGWPCGVKENYLRVKLLRSMC
jgi:hypothetical protein